jgi:hypothetical protein
MDGNSITLHPKQHLIGVICWLLLPMIRMPLLLALLVQLICVVSLHFFFQDLRYFAKSLSRVSMGCSMLIFNWIAEIGVKSSGTSQQTVLIAQEFSTAFQVQSHSISIFQAIDFYFILNSI